LLLGIAYYQLARQPASVEIGKALGAVALFLITVVGVAGFGHVVNDLTDIEQDRQANKPNSMQGLSAGQRLGVIASLVVAGILPWLFLPKNWVNLSFLGLQFGLLLAYSVRPLRLKENAELGVLCDALYGYTVPIGITWITFGLLSSGPTATVTWSFLLVCTWSLFTGVRNILDHQVLDYENDHRAGVATLATQWGLSRTQILISRFTVPSEILSFFGVSIAFSASIRFFLFAFIGYLSWMLFRVRALWNRPTEPSPKEPAHYRLVREMLFNDFYEKVLPLLMLTTLVVDQPSYGLLALVHVVLFSESLATFLTDNLRQGRNSFGWIAYNLRHGGRTQ
jgi:4-hydroxybenzoate polyprenyltransferase